MIEEHNSKTFISKPAAAFYYNMIFIKIHIKSGMSNKTTYKNPNDLLKSPNIINKFTWWISKLTIYRATFTGISENMFVCVQTFYYTFVITTFYRMSLCAVTLQRTKPFSRVMTPLWDPQKCVRVVKIKRQPQLSPLVRTEAGSASTFQHQCPGSLMLMQIQTSNGKPSQKSCMW